MMWIIFHLKFQSTQPSQAVTITKMWCMLNEDISIHTALAGCDEIEDYGYDYFYISIHTALAGCDIMPYSNTGL